MSGVGLWIHSSKWDDLILTSSLASWPLLDHFSEVTFVPHTKYSRPCFLAKPQIFQILFRTVVPDKIKYEQKSGKIYQGTRGGGSSETQATLPEWPFGGLELVCIVPNPSTGHLPKSEWHLKTFARKRQLARESSNEGGFVARRSKESNNNVNQVTRIAFPQAVTETIGKDYLSVFKHR